MVLYSSRFKAPHNRETGVMQLDPDTYGFTADLTAHLGVELEADDVVAYRESIQAARDAEMPLESTFISIDDFIPRKRWRLLSLCSRTPTRALPGSRRWTKAPTA